VKVPVNEPVIADGAKKYVLDALETGWISSAGKYISLFEETFAAFIDVKHAITVTSGTSALHLALTSLNIGKGDEVILPDFTMIACLDAVLYTGATPVFVDVDPETYCIDTDQIASKITDRTKAIMPVHIYGHSADMDPILVLAEKHNLYVIEDAAEVHGGTYKGKKCGGIGTVGCFSFYGNKIITTGEGGMLVTNNKELYEKAQILRDHGMSLSKKYWHDLVGFNYRMTNMQAAIGCAQMEKVDGILKTKRNIGSMYNKFFSGHKSLILPKSDNFSKHIYWMYPVIFNLRGKDNNKIRDDIADLLKLFKIDSRPFFFPIHIMPPYYENCSLPVSEKLSLTGIVLPSYVGITNNEIKKICNIILNRISELS